MHPSRKPRNMRHQVRAIFLLMALLGAVAGYLPAAAAAPIPLYVSSYVISTAHNASVPRSVALSAQLAVGDAVPAPATVSLGRQRYFSQTAHFLRGAFLDYWESHGATPVLGLPITEPVVEGGLTVQYLERVRLEYHPEIAGMPQAKVLLTRLGVALAEQSNLQFSSLPAGSNTPTSAFFSETGHNLANAFLTYWQRNGGLAVFGYPISEEFVEINAADRRQYTVQYFERNRFEWHPELKPPFNIQLGLLGVEYARSTNLDPVARILLPSPLPATDSSDLSKDPRLADLVEDGLLPAVQLLARTPQFRWVPGVIIENNIIVEFTTIDDEGVGGAFIVTRNNKRRYLIVVPESQRGEATEALASVIAHEATHAYDYVSGVTPQRSGCSIEEELRAYKNGLAAWVVLKGEGALVGSYTRNSFEDDINRSLIGFNNDRTALRFDLDLQASRDYLVQLYGPTCGR